MARGVQASYVYLFEEVLPSQIFLFYRQTILLASSNIYSSRLFLLVFKTTFFAVWVPSEWLQPSHFVTGFPQIQSNGNELGAGGQTSHFSGGVGEVVLFCDGLDIPECESLNSWSRKWSRLVHRTEIKHSVGSTLSVHDYSGPFWITWACSECSKLSCAATIWLTPCTNKAAKIKSLSCAWDFVWQNKRVQWLSQWCNVFILQCLFWFLNIKSTELVLVVLVKC